MGKAVRKALAERQTEKKGGGRVNGIPLKKLFAPECTVEAVLEFLNKSSLCNDFTHTHTRRQSKGDRKQV